MAQRKSARTRQEPAGGVVLELRPPTGAAKLLVERFRLFSRWKWGKTGRSLERKW
jgi:hypothetical protein